MMSAHCVRALRGTEQLARASLKIALVVHRLVALAARASLTIDPHAHVAKMGERPVHGAQMIVRHAQEAIAIVRHVHAAQMTVHRAQEVLMSARPVEVDLHSGDQQKVVGAQVREEVDRQRAVVARARVVVVQAMVVVVQHSGDQQKVAVGRSVMMIVR
jgi:hypothetical protein